MKKVIFSALALLVFSFAKAANEMEEKKQIVVKKEVVVVKPYCDSQGQKAFKVIADLGGTYGDCQKAKAAAISQCEKEGLYLAD